MASLKLKRLKIDKFRNVAPAELRFHDGLNVLLGQNGTGKTTLLKMIAMALSSNFSSLRQTEFDIEYDLAHPEFDLTVNLKNRPNEFEANPAAPADMLQRIGGPRESTTWSYTIKTIVRGTGEKHEISVSRIPLNERSKSFAKKYEQHNQESSPFVLGFVWLAIMERTYSLKPSEVRPLHLVIMTLWSSPAVRLDEGIAGFTAMTGSASHVDSLEINNAEVMLYKFDEKVHNHYQFFVPSSLTEKIKERTGKCPSIISINDTEVDFLEKVINIMQFTRGELIVELLNKNVNDRSTTSTYGHFGFRFTLDDGSVISHLALSYGQKRLLTFLYYCAASPEVIIVDELVNGLHYDWIQFCLDEIGDRQAFLTSQNPLLLDFLPFNSADDVQQTFVLCRTEKRDEKSKMVWSNFAEDDANRFYGAYEAGVQQVSEILRTKGLW